ncbi:glycosyltransferase [Sorangium atrum]|uniref:Glycosyltransferase n=1 Tax=Sorangium atrum TaxID=2995308 RepID=A0ABT5C1J3_9BACT|nr:glycosyltransferase [Sorangium aterium]MDC0679056.1 glycosyltransferase [Sorangium aterium]
MRIHIVTNIDNGKGLERDYRLLGSLLESWGHRVTGVHFQRVENAGGAGGADLVIFLEVYEPRLAEGAPRRWLIPNAEWWRPEMRSALDDFELVLCKTRDALSHFAPLTPRARHLGFFSEDRWDPAVPRARRFLHVPGGSDAKGTDSVLLAWERHRIPYPLTVVSSLGWPLRPRNVEFAGRVDERRLRFYQNASRFHLCPSRYEGWGHALHEGLSVGAAVLVPDTEAMSEIDGCALRMPAAPHGAQGLVRTHAVAPEDVRDAVERCMAFTEADLRRIQEAARDAYLSERERCLASLWEVLGERPALRGGPAAGAGDRGASAGDAAVGCGAARDAAGSARDAAGSAAGAPGSAAEAHARSAAPPRIALVIPCQPSTAPLLRRAVAALRAQTAAPSSFEVVVVCDGGDPGGAIRAAAEPGSHPFRVEIVDSPRPRGQFPHCSHARNAGVRAARAPLIWFVDADVLLSPEAVEHALSEHDAALARGVPAVLTPALARVALPPAAWIERSAAWAASGAVEGLAPLLSATPLDGGAPGAQGDRSRPGAPSSESLSDVRDGMPIVWRGLVDALGGFDEWFIGGGAEKGAFVDLLEGLRRADLIDIRLLTSVRALRQPQKPVSEAFHVHVHRGRDERDRRAREIAHGARWWRARLAAIRAALPPAVMAAAPDAPAAERLPDCSPDAVEARARLVRGVRAVAAPALRGLYGGVVVVGEAAELLARDVAQVCGLAARVATVAGLSALPANRACGVILSGVLAGATEDERARVLDQARRIVKATGPLLIAEIAGGSVELGAGAAGRDAALTAAEVRVRVERVGV